MPELVKQPLPIEAMLLKGICPCCLEAMTPLTWAEILEFKDDIGMGDNDDFFDACEECEKAFLPGFEGTSEERYRLVCSAEFNAANYSKPS
jgi:hypothetical protein